MLAEFSRIPASCTCTHSQDSQVLFWARGRFPPSRGAGVLPSLCPTCRKSQQLKKMGCFLLHLLNSGTGFVELTSGC